ncbi:hypothetical protein LH442_15350 [Laribacter hongkongensis]|uniref:hypothetical protein n=1 Tax=Laribacter hongkongensis TaxID=168471 RepID=UPI001EFC3025|nr:hypothetical protein [Laribacter hongkongensis]MCG9057313.1 hypothetical protein [Laribacter hongkongensis]
MKKIKPRSSRWYDPIVSKNGNVVYGVAALNVRIANEGGMDAILNKALAFGIAAAMENVCATLGIKTKK